MTNRKKLITTALWLAYVTIFYNVAEGIISVFFGASDETLALLGFGVDSFVEVISGINRTFTAILPRGATVEIQRPFGWEGEWYVHASYRTDPTSKWFGSWNHGTSEPVLTLPSLKQAEWRFALTPGADPNAEPIIRTVSVAPGQNVVVD